SRERKRALYTYRIHLPPASNVNQKSFRQLQLQGFSGGTQGQSGTRSGREGEKRKGSAGRPRAWMPPGNEEGREGAWIYSASSVYRKPPAGMTVNEGQNSTLKNVLQRVHPPPQVT
ncbi:hypothetical protein OS493_024112, partial [Desmophyllum pertusum]